MLHVPIDAIAVGPVAFDGDEREAFFADEPLRELGPPGVIVRGSVRRLSEKHITGIADALEQWVEVGSISQGLSTLSQALG